MEAPLQRRETLRSLTEVVITKKPPVQDTKRKLWRCSSFMRPDHGFSPSKHLIGSLLLLIQRHTEGRQLRGEEYYLTKRAQVCIIGLCSTKENRGRLKSKSKKNFDELIGWWAGGVRAGSYTGIISFWNAQNSLRTWSSFTFKSMR